MELADAVLACRRAGLYEEQIRAYTGLTFPLGELLTTKEGELMQVWPYWPGHLPGIKSACNDWSLGFSLVIGEPVKLEDPLGPNVRLVPCLTGDVPVWFEIKDVALARKLLEERADTPLPLRVDMIRYHDEIEYRHVVTTYHKYWSYWFKAVWRNGPGAGYFDLHPGEDEEDF